MSWSARCTLLWCLTFQAWSVMVAHGNADHVLSDKPIRKFIDVTRSSSHLPVQAFATDAPWPHSETFESYVNATPRPCQDARFDKYRRIDGVCNNLKRPFQGAALGTQSRLFGNFYQDGQSRPQILDRDNHYLPSARLVSNKCLGSEEDDDGNGKNRMATQMVWQFGQFLAHDISHVEKIDGTNDCCDRFRADEPYFDLVDPDFDHCLPIAIPEDDPQYHSSCMPFSRSFGVDVFGVREPINAVTSYIDASTVYGSSEYIVNELRTGLFGRLKTSRRQKHLPDFGDFPCMKSMQVPRCPAAGDVRVSDQPGLAALHTLFHREHIRIAVNLFLQYPYWNEERYFQETRKIVIGIIQKIVYEDYLPRLLGHDVMRVFGLNDDFVYDDKVDASAILDFTTSGLRFGHTLINTILEGSKLRDLFLQPIYDERFNYETMLLYQANHTAHEFNNRFTNEIRQHLFEGVTDVPGSSPPPGMGLDLMSLNIQRGRDHGIAPYIKVRDFCLDKLKDVTGAYNSTPECFTDGNLYSHSEDIDLFVGGVSEKPLPDAILGPTFACMAAIQFNRLKFGDRFFYQGWGIEGFNIAQRELIARTTLSSLICEINPNATMQRDAFKPVSSKNPAVPCSTIVRERNLREGLKAWLSPSEIESAKRRQKGLRWRFRGFNNDDGEYIKYSEITKDDDQWVEETNKDDDDDDDDDDDEYTKYSEMTKGDDQWVEETHKDEDDDEYSRDSKRANTDGDYDYPELSIAGNNEDDFGCPKYTKANNNVDYYGYPEYTKANSNEDDYGYSEYPKANNNEDDYGYSEYPKANNNVDDYGYSEYPKANNNVDDYGYSEYPKANNNVDDYGYSEHPKVNNNEDDYGYSEYPKANNNVDDYGYSEYPKANNNVDDYGYSEHPKANNNEDDYGYSEYPKTNNNVDYYGYSEYPKANNNEDDYGYSEYTKANNNEDDYGYSEYTKANNNEDDYGYSEYPKTNNNVDYYGYSEYPKTNNNVDYYGYSEYPKTNNNVDYYGYSEYPKTNNNVDYYGYSEYPKTNNNVDYYGYSEYPKANNNEDDYGYSEHTKANNNEDDYGYSEYPKANNNEDDYGYSGYPKANNNVDDYGYSEYPKTNNNEDDYGYSEYPKANNNEDDYGYSEYPKAANNEDDYGYSEYPKTNNNEGDYGYSEYPKANNNEDDYGYSEYTKAANNNEDDYGYSEYTKAANNNEDDYGYSEYPKANNNEDDYGYSEYPKTNNNEDYYGYPEYPKANNNEEAHDYPQYAAGKFTGYSERSNNADEYTPHSEKSTNLKRNEDEDDVAAVVNGLGQPFDSTPNGDNGNGDYIINNDRTMMEENSGAMEGNGGAIKGNGGAMEGIWWAMGNDGRKLGSRESKLWSRESRLGSDRRKWGSDGEGKPSALAQIGEMDSTVWSEYEEGKPSAWHNDGEGKPSA